MARTTQAATTGGWQELATALEANAGDLPHLETHRLQLAEMLEQAIELSRQQAALTASKQAVSRQVQFLLEDGEKLATFLRTGVRQHYGNRSEKLVEFGLRPLRTRRRRTEPTPPPQEPPPGPPVEIAASPAADSDSE